MLMKILAPIDRFYEAERLIQAGADELYGGFVPSSWAETFTMAGSINKRSFQEAQFASRQELEETIELIHRNNAAFFLTLNNDYYSEKQYPLVLKEVEWAQAAGVDALLVADIGLILEITKLEIPIELHLSILSSVLNSRAAAFYRSLGVRRIVLDRTLSLSEISHIVQDVDDVRFEVFVMYGKCPNVEGLCTFFHHDDPKHVWPCCRNYTISTVSGSREADEVLHAIEAQSAWSAHERGQACGLCAMYDLDRAGVYSLKIAGRGRYTDDKVRAVRMVEEMRSLLGSGVSRQDFVKAARELFVKTYGKECNPYVCYCPEIR